MIFVGFVQLFGKRGIGIDENTWLALFHRIGNYSSQYLAFDIVRLRVFRIVPAAAYNQVFSC